MKLKRRPEDFRVEELPTVEPGGRGHYTFYRLSKRGMGTLEAVEAIRRRWNLSQAQINYGGLKDRHAETVQYLTIERGRNQALRESSFELEPLGRLNRPYGPAFFRGNRFDLVLRDMSEEEAALAAKGAAELPSDGLPNYFDDQRFGSVGMNGDFIAQAWLAGDHERALRLAIAEPNPVDRGPVRMEKTYLRTLWGKWPEAKARLEKSHARSLVTYLVDHPTDFRGAFARVRRDLRSLYFSAFQSHLWNLMLSRLIETLTRPEQRKTLHFKVADLFIHQGLDPYQAETLAAWKVPLPASRTPLPEGPATALALEVLGPMGLKWEELRVKHLKDVFFSKGTRDALFFARDLRHETTPDDLYPGRLKMALGFELPKGAYATMVVKRLLTDGEVEDEPGEPAPTRGWS